MEETTYYRFSNSDNPMSEWGHAMFCEDEEHVSHYGKNEFTYNGNKSVTIESLHDTIVAVWNETLENCLAPACFEELDGEEIYNEFNPEDIVESAAAWDCEELCAWFFENIAQVHDIEAITLYDGAIVFNEDLISKYGKN